MSSSGGDPSVFTETSVILDYVLERENSSGCPIFENHPCQPVASREVEKEFERVNKRRHRLHLSFLEYARTGDIDEYEPPDDLGLTGNDLSYLYDRIPELDGIEDEVDVLRRVNELKRRTNSAMAELFEGSDPIVKIVRTAKDPALLAYLKDLLQQNDDARILTEAADWSSNDGSGDFLTNDRDDMLSNKEDINRLCERHLSTSLDIQTPIDYLP